MKIHNKNKMRYAPLVQKYSSSYLFFLALLCSMLFVLSPMAAAKDIDVQAVVNRTQITPEQTIELQVIVDGGKADVDVSVIEDFQILSKGRSSSRSYVNGSFSHKEIYSYLLSPLRSGNLSIPAIAVTQKGKTVFTKPISIKADAVLGASFSDQFFARASVSRATPFVGEAFVYTLSLFCASPLAHSMIQARLQPPSFEGFSVTELEDKRQTENEVINGISFQVTKVFYLLESSSEGVHEIEPARVIARIPEQRAGTSRGHGNLDPFADLDHFLNPGSSFFSMDRTRPVHIASAPVSVRVTPLPPYDGEGKFSGLIGHFDLDASIDKKQLAVGDSATLTFILSGRGNIMDAGKPQEGLPEKDWFTIYDDTPEEDIHISEKGYEGKKTFPHAIVALQPGETRIPGVSLVYFDVEKEKYIHLHGPSFEVVVKEPKGEKKAAGANKKTAQKDAAASGNADIAQEKDILPGKAGEEEAGETKESSESSFHNFSGIFHFFQSVRPYMNIRLIGTAAGLVLAAVGLIVLVSRLRRSSAASQPLLVLAKEAKQVRMLAGKADPCTPDSWRLLYLAFMATIWQMAGQKEQNLTTEQIREILCQKDEKGERNGIVEEFLCAMEKIQAVRFGGLPAQEEDFFSCLGILAKLSDG